MDRSNVKKAVRFSSPFDTEPEATSANASGIRRESSTTTTRRRSSAGKSSSAGTMDSWDAFDAKMSKSKTTAPKIVENQFLELSVSQNKSLNLNAEDFSNFSFQDPKGLIDRDENERLQFMNSNISFSEGNGIDQIEAPSLLSITNYFQQGSSFPVPYVGNDSTMMFGARESLAGISYSDPNTQVKSLTSSQSQISMRNSSSSRPSSISCASASTVVAGDNKPDLSRNNSLAQFFLGPQPNGMKSNDILEYVIDYCNRRASSSSASDKSDVVNSPITGNNSSLNNNSEKHDSGIGFANEEKTVIQTTVAKELSDKEVAHQIYNLDTPNIEMTPRRTKEFTPPQKDEESVMLAEARSLKTEASLLDVSDVGSIEGFENFKKNLNHNNKVEDKYRAKVKHRAEFERKRLYVDERNSHPGLSPKGLSGPGSTASLGRPSRGHPIENERQYNSLEKPNKNMLCNSPPEKLVTSKKGILVDNCQSPLIIQTSRNSEGQYQSTPVTNESYISKLVPLGRVEKPTNNIENQMEKENSDDKQKRQKVAHSSNNNFSSSNNSQQVTYSESKQMDHLELKNNGNGSSSGNQQEGKPNTESSICAKRPTSISTDPAKGLKLPEGLSILPVIHSGLQQHLTGQHCSCPHQCGQQPSPLGMAPGHGPIVIHIHLPCTVTTSGTVMHPVPSQADHPK